jgi:CheY-like chemotaxis protein
LENDDFWLIVQVKDTGIGIPREDLPKIFSYYFRGNAASDPAIQGTGLGLPITKMLVGMMDGSVNVESVYGKGSTFTAKFKQRPATDAKISMEVIQTLKYFDYSNTKRRLYRNLERKPLPDAKVLVVDDVQINIDVLKGFLKPYQMQVDYVTTGQQAIDMIREGKIKYNAIFMDHLLPDINGIDVTRQIRNMDTEYAKNIPIIAFTANTLLGNEKMFLDAGSQDFISKPITLDKLDMVIQRWVGTKPFFERSFDNKQNYFTSEHRIDGLDIPVAIENFGGDEELLFNTLRSFKENVPDLIKKAALPEKDTLSEYTSVIHSIKGACRIIHADDLANRAEELELASKSGDTKTINNKNEEFLSDVKKFITGLETLLAELIL